MNPQSQWLQHGLQMTDDTEPRRKNSRFFSRSDDELILRHVNGEFSSRVLERMLRSTRKTLEGRAAELGVQLRYRPRDTRALIGSRRARNEEVPDTAEYGRFYSCSVGDDPLLAALNLHHPDRAP